MWLIGEPLLQLQCVRERGGSTDSSGHGTRLHKLYSRILYMFVAESYNG